jgi:predicted transcriptional regulator YheO
MVASSRESVSKACSVTNGGWEDHLNRAGGRPKAKMLDNPKKVALAQSLYENRDNTIDEICKTLNVSRATLYRYIKTKAT